MASEGDNEDGKIVSLASVREQLIAGKREEAGHEKDSVNKELIAETVIQAEVQGEVLAFSITFWKTHDPENPVDVRFIVLDEENDSSYNFAALFLPQPGEDIPRLIKTAEGLEALAGQLRQLHASLARVE